MSDKRPAITLTLSVEDVHTLIFGLNRAARDLRDEHDRTDNPRSVIHADRVEKVRASISAQAAIVA